MRKTILEPDDGDGSSLGTALHAPDGLDVSLSGLCAPGDDVAAQTRAALSRVRRVVCDDLGGELEDVTRLRVFVREDTLTPETRAALDRVRRQTFEWPTYPAVTTVGVASLGRDDALVEVEAEAFVPYDGWETAVLEADAADGEREAGRGGRETERGG